MQQLKAPPPPVRCHPHAQHAKHVQRAAPSQRTADEATPYLNRPQAGSGRAAKSFPGQRGPGARSTAIRMRSTQSSVHRVRPQANAQLVQPLRKVSPISVVSLEHFDKYVSHIHPYRSSWAPHTHNFTIHSSTRWILRGSRMVLHARSESGLTACCFVPVAPGDGTRSHATL